MIEKYVDAEELKRLLSVLVVILGCLVLAALFGSIVVPGLRNANRPATPAAMAPVGGQPGWLNEEEPPAQKGSVVPPVDPKTLIAPSAELLARGKTLFEKNCTQCHGSLGRGDGPAAATMNPRPRNFSAPEGWKNGSDMPGIYRTVSEGIGGTAMSSFDYLSKKDRMALVHFARSLASPPPRAASPQAMEALAAQLASAGEIIPNSIPVSAAIAKVSAEYKPVAPLVLREEDRSPGAEVIRRILWDPDRAARFLAESVSWQAGFRELASAVLLNSPDNGFAVDSATLSTADWQALYAELLKRVHSQP